MVMDTDVQGKSCMAGDVERGYEEIKIKNTVILACGWIGFLERGKK